MKTMTVNCFNCKIEFQKPIAYIKQGEKRGCFKHFCSNKCCCLFNNNLFKNDFPNIRKTEYYNNPKKCPNCSKSISYEDKSWQTYCSKKCSAIYTQRNGGHNKWLDKNKQNASIVSKNLWKTGIYDHLKSKKIKKNCLNCKSEFFVLPFKQNQIYCSRMCWNRWVSDTGYLKGKSGGYRPNSGTSKRGWYKGIFCGSSWELAWVIYNLDHNISFERNNEGFHYQYNGQNKKYYPDFKTSSEYVEIKGYHSKQFDAKMAQFPHRLKVLHKMELKEMLDYVKLKYGRDFTSLYEKEKTS